MKRAGPKLTTVKSCDGCEHVATHRYRVQGDSGTDVSCTHPSLDGGMRDVGDTTWNTPDWCPVDEPLFNLAAFHDAKSRWSLATFGPGDRYQGVVAHIRQELLEIEQEPSDLEEWVDVALLAMDGAFRSAKASGEEFVAMLVDKQRRNVERRWPDWRGLKPGEVSEHIKTEEEAK